MGSTNQVDVVQPQPSPPAEEVSEVHVRNPNYMGKNYDPNFQAKHAEAAHSVGKQQQNTFTAPSQYKQAYNKPTSTYSSNNNTALPKSSDIIGEVTLKISVDGYQLLKVSEMIKYAVAWRAKFRKLITYLLTSMATIKMQLQRYRSLRCTSMKPHLKSWAKLQRTSATQNRSSLRQWRCINISAIRTWRMSPSSTHKTDYLSTTDLMATTKMYIAWTSTL